MPNVADRIVETLEAANVRRIYGLVGDSLNGSTEVTARARQDPVDCRQARRSRRICRRRAGAADGRSCRVRRKLWTRQFAP